MQIGNEVGQVEGKDDEPADSDGYRRREREDAPSLSQLFLLGEGDTCRQVEGTDSEGEHVVQAEETTGERDISQALEVSSGFEVPDDDLPIITANGDRYATAVLHHHSLDKCLPAD